MPLDSQNMLQAIKDFPRQCKEALTLPKGLSIPGKISNIVVLGMGGSAIGGDLLKAYMRNSKIPVFVNRDYTVPGFVNNETLVFAVSYSGNTEETLKAYYDAYQKKARIIAITSNGVLNEECKEVIKVPSGFQPRAALGYLFFPMLGVLHNMNIFRVRNEELNEMFEILKKTDKFVADAEAISKKIRDNVPIIYSSENLSAAAFRWKTQINENAKMPAFYNVFSEMNHNEIASYQFIDKRFVPVLIRDSSDNERIIKRMDVCKQIMEEKVDVVEAHAQGNGLLARLFSAIYLGDFVSYFLALRNRVDPGPVNIIEGMKKRLG